MRRYSLSYVTKENCKLKQQWDITTHLLEWLKSKPLVTPILARTWNNRNGHSRLVGMQNGTTTTEDKLSSFYQSLTNQKLCFLVFSQISWKLMSTQKSYPGMFIPVLFITAKLESNQMSFKRQWMYKWTDIPSQYNIIQKRKSCQGTKRYTVT